MVLFSHNKYDDWRCWQGVIPCAIRNIGPMVSLWFPRNERSKVTWLCFGQAAMPGMCWYALISRPTQVKRRYVDARLGPEKAHGSWVKITVRETDTALDKSKNCAVLSNQHKFEATWHALPAANVRYVTLTSEFWLRRHLWAAAPYGRDESMSGKNPQSSVNWFSRRRWRVFHQATSNYGHYAGVINSTVVVGFQTSGKSCKIPAIPFLRWGKNNLVSVEKGENVYSW